jgi:hypothetical protein
MGLKQPGLCRNPDATRPSTDTWTDWHHTCPDSG